MSCFNISTQRKNWDNAKAACQSAGERLAVFDSLESISWVKHMRKTRQGLYSSFSCFDKIEQ